MARKWTIDALPADVRSQLLDQYRQFPGWTISDHAEWLSSQGYTVSRSAVHRYLVAKSAPEPSASAASSEYRMRCLEVASSLYKGSNPQELISLAESLMTWVEMPS